VGRSVTSATKVPTRFFPSTNQSGFLIFQIALFRQRVSHVQAAFRFGARVTSALLEFVDASDRNPLPISLKPRQPLPAAVAGDEVPIATIENAARFPQLRPSLTPDPPASIFSTASTTGIEISGLKKSKKTKNRKNANFAKS